MCVICVAEKRRPTADELSQMYSTNAHGAGIAYRNGDLVKWEKGLNLEQIQALAEEAPLPFVCHFRIATYGGTLPELTHPFPVEKELRNSLSGETPGYVLFHNGSWSGYRDTGVKEAIENRVKVPDGAWSDTRVMAWMAHLHSPNILTFLDEKIILFGPKDILVFNQERFCRVNGLFVSNRNWEAYSARKVETFDSTRRPSGFMSVVQPDDICRVHSCKKKVVDSYWCEDHLPHCREVRCSSPRLAGTDWCAAHQPPCSASSCKEPRVVGEKFCLEHLKETVAGAGGDQPPVPFRGTAEVAKEGADHQGAGAGGTGTVDGVGSQLSTASSVTHCSLITDPHMAEEERWIRSLNPKPIRSAVGHLLAIHRPRP
jgi:hypothetical protein